MYRIGDFSKMAKLTVKTLRFYDTTELLQPEYTDRITGYRYYSTSQLISVSQIVSLRQAGFSINEIKDILSGKGVKLLLEKKRVELLRELELSAEKLCKLDSLRKNFSEENKMNCNVVIKDLQECTVYYSRFKVHDFKEYGEKIPEIGRRIAAANPELKCAEPNFCYVEYLDGEFKNKDFTVEYGEAVKSVGVPTDGISFKTIPAGKYACIMHKGAYQTLNLAYAKLLGWIESNGYSFCGNGREQYIDGCWNKSDEADYLTEVQFPVVKK